MVTLLKQTEFTFNSLLEDIGGSKCCVIKVRQYISCQKSVMGASVSVLQHLPVIMHCTLL